MIDYIGMFEKVAKRRRIDLLNGAMSSLYNGARDEARHHAYEMTNHVNPRIWQDPTKSSSLSKGLDMMRANEEALKVRDLPRYRSQQRQVAALNRLARMTKEDPKYTRKAVANIDSVIYKGKMRGYMDDMFDLADSIRNGKMEVKPTYSYEKIRTSKLPF